MSRPMKKLFLFVVAAFLTAGRIAAQTATVTPSVTTYDPAGGQVTFTVTLAFPTNSAAVAFSAKPQASIWTHLSSTHLTPVTPVGAVLPFSLVTAPHAGATSDPLDPKFEFGWAYENLELLGTGGASFTFVLSYPAGLTGNQTITLAGHYRPENGAFTEYTIPSVVFTPPVAPSFTSQPSNSTVGVGANATFTVAAVGPPAPAIKWQRSVDGGVTFADLSSDATFSGVASATLTITAVSASLHGSRFRAIASNGALPDATSTPAVLSVNSSPVFVTHPRSQAVSAAGNLILTAAAAGFPAPTYQWMKGSTALVNGGRISGATTATLTVSAVEAGDAGSYTVVATNGIAPNATSNAAAITVGPTGFGASHALLGAGYTPGGTLTVTNTLIYSGELSSLSWSVLLPAGWSFESAVNAGSPSTQPSVNDISVLDWAWATAPASGSTFTYTLKIPANAQGSQSLVAMVAFGIGESTLQLVATPDPLPVNQIFTHTADTNQNFKIDLSELTRVITLYNARFDTGAGKVRTGGYKLQAGTADGFATDAARDPAVVVNFGAYHAADYNRNGKIDLAELTRIITLYNTRYDTGAGKVRTGYYKIAVGVTTVDGYTTDPTRAP